MDKNLIRDLQNYKLDVESLENELQKMFEELRGKNSSLYVSDLNKAIKYKRATEVSAQLLECYRLKIELIKQLNDI
ncbi:hypothetical protein DP145_06860 [Clostridium tetani]|uniref:hypothetical protein n=1 Tax=Clostridium tetani TaxID=1513 RepID=UPI00100A5422|nr:hypothetical protein [Clostridium tetani]RXI46289.1 hypothetical protein DP126_05065 [Clostridium tetani]RXM61787.1 hypothetical protein DP138_02980 [Clostridium tetani]RXM67595.1 hypothetical protein DP145_06860 [Clostridium tetani]